MIATLFDALRRQYEALPSVAVETGTGEGASVMDNAFVATREMEGP